MNDVVRNSAVWWYWNEVFDHDTLVQFGNIIESLGHEESEESQCNGKDTKSFFLHDYDNYIPALANFESIVVDTVRKQLGYDVFSVDRHNVLLNYYNSISTGYPWHLDADSSPYVDTKATCIINASTEPYEGGELYLATNGIPKDGEFVKEMETPGSAIVFRSNILHRVAPVLRGQRRSMVFFFDGPAWR